jgi:hypothetical protein
MMSPNTMKADPVVGTQLRNQPGVGYGLSVLPAFSSAQQFSQEKSSDA